MPNRILRDGILTSEPVAELTWAAEVFYRRLMSVADDHGRYYALPKLIRSACYPLQIDKVSDADIGKWLTECVTAGLVSVYPAQDGKRYLLIEKFGQQVRSKSKFPEAVGGKSVSLLTIDSNCDQVISNAHLGVCEGVCEGEGVDSPAPASPTPAAITIPLNSGEYAVTDDQVREFTGLYPAVDILAELRKIKGWAMANPTKRKTKAGILRHINSWLSRAQDGAGRTRNGGGWSGGAPEPPRATRDLL